MFCHVLPTRWLVIILKNKTSWVWRNKYFLRNMQTLFSKSFAHFFQTTWACKISDSLLDIIAWEYWIKVVWPFLSRFFPPLLRQTFWRWWPHQSLSCFCYKQSFTGVICANTVIEKCSIILPHALLSASLTCKRVIAPHRLTIWRHFQQQIQFKFILFFFFFLFFEADAHFFRLPTELKIHAGTWSRNQSVLHCLLFKYWN